MEKSVPIVKVAETQKLDKDAAKPYREKINQLSRKLEEERIQSQQLKSELIKTQKALQLEVGPDVNLQEVLVFYEDNGIDSSRKWIVERKITADSSIERKAKRIKRQTDGSSQ